MQNAATLPNAAGRGGENSSRAAEASVANVRVPAFSDPNAARMNIRLTTVILFLLIALCSSLAWNFIQWFSGPALVIANKLPNGDIQVTSFNGRPVQSEDNSVSVERDAVMAGDKTYYAGEFARLLYAPNPRTRGEDVERALHMMVEDRAKQLMGCLSRGCDEYDLNLDRQRAESWQTVWTEQSKEVDPHDPYTVHITGLQQLTKVVKNMVQKETKQISLAIKLVQDPLGRHNRNQRSGVLVDSFQYKVISSSAQ